ncbi:hypothetical protein [Streptomyces sp. NBC_00102]|uniref:hypothetical protein n=1 Tax=Streptomyces sp. NBC_00102 TaxID=2975652 RepID=UPI00225A1C6E|nr:hypothetical protein [Streptomyces sp. NBC_00102]MCX5399032.1 hypothetical protein [Streptomyces sp. NBC_00102]
MTYDITLVRVEPGLTLHEALDRINTGYDPDAEPTPYRPTDAHRDEWARILERVAREVGPVESEEYPYGLTLETVGPPGRVQLDHCGDTAHIEVAHHHAGAAASAVMDVAYRIARIVEDESGMTGHDFEVDQPTRTGDPARAAARLSGVSVWAQAELGGAATRGPGSALSARRPPSPVRGRSTAPGGSRRARPRP